MARHTTAPVANNTDGVRTVTGVTGTIVGVELRKTIEQGFDSNGNPTGEVRVRPTNVTATLGETVDTADSFIVLHNGPHGGFTQQYNGADTLFTNSVIAAVITNS